MSICQSYAYVYYGPGQMKKESITIKTGPTDMVIKVLVCGRCGTEKNLWYKEHPAVQVPTVLGHELVGEIMEIGGDVNGFQEGIGYYEGKVPRRFHIGQKVTIQPRIARYKNGLMLMRNPIENVSFRLRGGYSQYMRIPESMIRAGEVIPVSASIRDEEGALIEPAACALESIFSTPHSYGVDGDGRHNIAGGIKKGGRVCIIGSGTLSMIYGTLCRLDGAAELWYIVRSEEKAALIRRIVGYDVKTRVIPDYSMLPIEEKLRHESGIEAAFMELTDGCLFDDIVLAAASADAQRLMMRLFNPDGYGVAAEFAGLRELSEKPNVDAVHYRIGKIIGTSGCGTAAMETIARWLVEGKLSLKGYMSGRHFTLDDDPEVFLTARGDGLKPMLYPWERGCV